MNKLKNIDPSKVLAHPDLVGYQEHQVASKTLVQNQAVGITLFSFDKGEGISSHTSTGDALVQILDGQAEITIDSAKYTLSAGEMIVMPAGHPHALYALERFKMLLTVVF